MNNPTWTARGYRGALAPVVEPVEETPEPSQETPKQQSRLIVPDDDEAFDTGGLRDIWRYPV